MLARTPEKAEPLRQIATASGMAITVLPLTAESLDVVDASLVISTLPGDAAPVPLLRQSSLPSRSDLLDVAYHPWPSALGALWSLADRQVVSGVRMLLHQALLQVRVFVHGDPTVPLTDEAAVLSAMDSSLAAPGASPAP